MPVARTTSVRRALTLGAVSGVRTFTSPAVLAARGRWGQGRVARLLSLAAVGELLGDKSPVIPPRSDPPSLIGRVVSGAASGAAVAGARGAGAGAAGAAATTYASERLRSLVGEYTGFPDPVLGLAEDAVVLGVAVLATRTAVEASDAQPAPHGTGDEPGPPAAVTTPTARRPLSAVARGLGAAAVGTAAMTSVQTAYLKATGSEPSDVPAEMGRRIITGVLRRRMPRGRREAVNQGMHALYGTSWGVPLGLFAGSLRRRPSPAILGGLFGITVWATSLVLLPALKLSPPASEQSRSVLAVDLSMHLVYGAAAGAVYAALAEPA